MLEYFNLIQEGLNGWVAREGVDIDGRKRHHKKLTKKRTLVESLGEICIHLRFKRFF